jgi:AcrR family transcriptional regulator
MHPTRIRILSTTPAVFAEAGFAGSSTRQLAAAAGVNIATLAYHFGDKQGLYEAAIDHVFGTLLDAPLPDLEGLPRSERLRAFMGAIFSTACEQRDGIRLLLRHVISEGGLPTAVNKRWRHRMLSRVQEVLDTLGIGDADPLALLSLNHLIARYAVSDPADIAPFSLGRDPHEAVVDHLTAVARAHLHIS